MDKNDADNKDYLLSTRIKLTKLEIKIASLPDIPAKHILQREVDKARSSLDEDEAEYANVLWNDLRRRISRIKLRYLIIPHSTNSFVAGSNNIACLELGRDGYSLPLRRVKQFCTLLCASEHF